MRALENYADPKDIRRVILNTHSLDVNWLIAYLGRLEPALTL
jgi:clathrin heavy chain